MAEREIARKINIAWAINTKKDFCKVGNATIPFDIVCDLSKATTHSRTVFANSKEALTVTHRIPGMVGNAGKGVDSGVSQLAGYVLLSNGSPTVIINDQASVRHGDDCKMNCDAAGKSNVPGKVYTSPVLAALASDAYQDTNAITRNLKLANLQVETWKAQAADEMVRGTKHFFGGLKDSAVTAWQALGWTGTDAATQAARGRIMAGLEGLGTLMGPPPEMVQGAYMSGNAESIAMVQTMQRNQQAAWGAVGNSIATAWNDAYARSGPVGAASMVFTAIGWNVAAGAATGAGVGAAARLAVNVGGRVLEVSASVGGRIAEVLANAKTPAQAAKGFEEAITAAKAAGASADDIAALQAAKDAVAKGQIKPPAEPVGPGDGVVVKKAVPKHPPGTVQKLLERKWGKADVDEALRAKRADPKLDGLLTDDEYLAVRGYTSNLYSEINPALRSGNPGEWGALSDEASSAMQKLADNGYGFKGGVFRDASFTSDQIKQLFPEGGRLQTKVSCPQQPNQTAYLVETQGLRFCLKPESRLIDFQTLPMKRRYFSNPGQALEWCQ